MVVSGRLYGVVMSACFIGGSDLRKGQNYRCGAPRCSARGCGVLGTLVVDKCLVPVPIGFLFSPAVI